MIDIIVVVILFYGAIKGYQKGLIVAIFSILAFIIGLAAAIKLSALVADKLGQATNISQQWLPIISFAVVFIAVVLLIRLGAAALQRAISFAFLGLANRIGGMILYMLLYLFIFSVILFYIDQIDLLKPKTKEASVTWKYVQPLGPKVIDGFGKIIPWFKDMFNDLQQFFGKYSDVKR